MLDRSRPCFVVITGFNDNDNMMLVVNLVVVFVVNFAMTKVAFRVVVELIVRRDLLTMTGLIFSDFVGDLCNLGDRSNLGDLVEVRYSVYF